MKQQAIIISTSVAYIKNLFNDPRIKAVCISNLSSGLAFKSLPKRLKVEPIISNH
jgi:hypothetical protein